MTPAETIRRIIDEHTQLSNFGFGVFAPYKKSPEQAATELAQSREEMFEQRSIDQFESCCNWLRSFPKTKSINRRVTSYGLKHLAERDIDYVTNGIFIAAAIAEGFRFERVGPNAVFNIAMAAVRRARHSPRDDHAISPY